MSITNGSAFGGLRPRSSFQPKKDQAPRKLTAKEIFERNTTFRHVNKINLQRAKELKDYHDQLFPPRQPPKRHDTTTPYQNSYSQVLH
jgi:hypothetical protein